MAFQTRRFDPFGFDTYRRVRAETDRAARLGLGRHRTSRQFPINHLANRAADVPRARVEHERAVRLAEVPEDQLAQCLSVRVVQ